MAKFRLTENGIAAAARGIGAALDAAGAAGALELYDKDGGSLLAKLRFQRPAVADVVGGDVRFFGLSPELDAPGRGRATWAKATDSAGNAVFECDVGPKGEGATIQLDEDDFVRKGDLVRVSEFSMKLGQAK